MYLLIDPKMPRSYIQTNIYKSSYRSAEYEHCSNSIAKIAIDRFTIYRDIGIYDIGWLIRSSGLYVLIDRPFKDSKLSL